MVEVKSKFLTNFFVMGIAFVMLCIPVNAMGIRNYGRENGPTSSKFSNRSGTGMGGDVFRRQIYTPIENVNADSEIKEPEVQVSSRSIQADQLNKKDTANETRVDSKVEEPTTIGDNPDMSGISVMSNNEQVSSNEPVNTMPKENLSFYQRIQNVFKSLFNGGGFGNFWNNLFGGEREKDVSETVDMNSTSGTLQDEPETILTTQSSDGNTGSVVRDGILKNPDISDLIVAGDGGGSDTIQEGKQALVDFMKKNDVPQDMQALFLAESMTEHHEIPSTLNREDGSKDGDTDMNIGTFNDNVDMLVTYGGLKIPMNDGTFKNTDSENFSWDDVDWEHLNAIYGDGPYGNGPTDENLKKIVDAKIKALETLGVERYLKHRRAGDDAFVDAGNTLGEDGLPIIRDEDYGKYAVEDADQWFRGHSYKTQELLDDPSKMTDNRRYAFVFGWI